MTLGPSSLKRARAIDASCEVFNNWTILEDGSPTLVKLSSIKARDHRIMPILSCRGRPNTGTALNETCNSTMSPTENMSGLAGVYLGNVSTVMPQPDIPILMTYLNLASLFCSLLK